MNNNDIIQPIKDTLNTANDIYVFLPQRISIDIVAAGLSLYQALQQTKKNIYIACPTSLDEKYKKITGHDQISQTIGNRNLVISLSVDQKDSIDKVSYNLDEENSTFNLIIQPKSGVSALKSDQVSYSYSGAEAELIFVVGATKLEDLDSFYQSERKLFSQAQIVSLSKYQANKFAHYHYTHKSAGSISEIAYYFIKQIGFNQIDKVTATNLITGIDSATQKLQSPLLKADTLSTMAELMRSGGTRSSNFKSSVKFPGTNLKPGAFSSQKAKPSFQDITPSPVLGQVTAPQPIAKTSDDTKDQNQGDVPQEWLTPKIYKSSPSKKS